MTAPPRAIVFDLDDTLYLERDYALSGYRAAAAALADRIGDAEQFVEFARRALDGPMRGRVFDAVLARLGLAGDATLLDALIAAYRDHVPKISLCADADRALARLAPSASLGLISDGRLTTQQRKIDALGLRGRLHELILTDEWGPAFWKPHPRAYLDIAGRFGVPAERCCYVADNPRKDFVAPNALGWCTIQIRRPGALYLDDPPPPNGAPARIVTTLDELV